jgi:hypothetical protein
MGPLLAFPFPRRGSRDGSSREPVENISNLQDRFLCAGIGQLPGYLARLFGAVEPVKSIIGK